MQTSLIIKSYNRAFYLERCIKSAQEMLVGDYQIVVADDGTPAKYLEKIRQLYPKVIIKTSENYSEKAKGVEENAENGRKIDGFGIPTALWISTAIEASEYFIMTEDDVWFSEKINLNQIVKDAEKHKISLLKLGWLGNHRDDKWLEISDINTEISATKPKNIFLKNPVIMDWFFNNKFKFFTIAYLLKFFDNETRLKYWALNSIMMGLWKKDYWLEVWKDAQERVDERQQLINAANFYRKNKSNGNFLARLKKEAMKTTFQSSATNSYHEYGFDFDVNKFNHILNEAWLNGDFDAMQNFPNDFSADYFERFISKEIDVEKFQKWAEKFREQYANLGCEVNNS